MKRLLKNLFFFSLVNLAIFCVVLYAIHFMFIKKHWSSDPDIFVIPQQQTYQFLVMGTSHARIFTRYDNQHIVEDILHKKFFNISQPDAGPVMEKLYLQFFLERGNRAKTIVYFIDPHVFYSDRWNENYYLLPYGALDLHFLTDSIKNNIGYATNLDYIKTYLSLKWFIKNPKHDMYDDRAWKKSDAEVANRLKKLYPNDTSDIAFEKYKTILDQITELAKKNTMQIVFVIPTTQIKNQPGMDKLKNLLEKYKKEKKINYYDFSHVVKDPHLYSDVDHLNTKGVALFTKEYLAKIAELKN